VQYDGGCDNPVDPNHPHLTAAIDALCDNAGLYYVSGDGQEGAPGKALLQRLQVRVANGAWPVKDARVNFAVITGGGTVQAGGVNAPSATAVTNANGIAEAGWTLGPTGRQRVQASLGEPASAFAVAFNAQFADTGGGTEPEPGIHVATVRLNAAGDLLNDLVFPADALVEGVDVVLSDLVDPASIEGKPVLVLTVELPFPQFEGSVVGFMPLALRGDVSQPSGEVVRWFPATDGVIPWLMDNVSAAKQRGVERVLARLRLMGSFIWGAEDRSIFVDGESFGAPSDDGRTEILRDASGLMSGDGRRGGDFEMWFWLVG
jgi:hypothetical protein